MIMLALKDGNGGVPLSSMCPQCVERDLGISYVQRRLLFPNRCNQTIGTLRYNQSNRHVAVWGGNVMDSAALRVHG